jgi:hypothetical protein
MPAPRPAALARPRAARLNESGKSLKRPVRRDGPWIANGWFITEVPDHHSSNSRDRVPVMIRIGWLTPCQPVYPSDLALYVYFTNLLLAFRNPAGTLSRRLSTGIEKVSADYDTAQDRALSTTASPERRRLRRGPGD